MPDLVIYVVLLFIFLLFLTLAKKRSSAAQARLPPSPPMLPIIGNLHQLGPLVHRSLAALAKAHGPIMVVHFGRVPTFVISSADLAREALKTHDATFASRPFLKVVYILFFGNVDVGFTPYGPYWRWARRIVSLHLLSAKQVQLSSPVREQEVAAMVETVEADQSRHSVVDVSEILYAFTNSLICRLVSGDQLTRDGRRTEFFRELITEHFALLGQNSLEEALPAWAAWLGEFVGLTRTTARANRNRKRWDAILDEVIEEHRRKLKKEEGEERTTVANDEDFVDVLLSLKEKGVEADEGGFVMDDNNMKALLLDMFAAGTDTTFGTLEWAMTEIVKNPTVYIRLRDEVRFQAKKCEHGLGVLTSNELNSMAMPYLKAVIMETLRLHPIGPLLVPRETTEDCIIGGYRIPRGSRVLINAWMISRDPSYWEAPEEFNPDRFVGSDIDFKGNNFNFIPFGAGRRICPGLLLSASTMELALANLMYYFDWELPGGSNVDGMDMNETTGLTCRKEKKLELVARRVIYNKCGIV